MQVMREILNTISRRKATSTDYFVRPSRMTINWLRTLRSSEPLFIFANNLKSDDWNTFFGVCPKTLKRIPTAGNFERAWIQCPGILRSEQIYNDSSPGNLPHLLYHSNAGIHQLLNINKKKGCILHQVSSYTFICQLRKISLDMYRQLIETFNLLIFTSLIS